MLVRRDIGAASGFRQDMVHFEDLVGKSHFAAIAEAFLLPVEELLDDQPRGRLWPYVGADGWLVQRIDLAVIAEAICDNLS